MTAMPDEQADDVVYIPMPFGLVGQWLQFERWKMGDSSFRKELQAGLNDWEGRWSMLHWVTEKVIEDHAVASQTPRNYMSDVSLEYHLTFWFLTARLCYDTIAQLAVQMAAERDRGKIPGLSFTDLSKAKEQLAFQDMTKDLVKIVKGARETFEELRTIRDSLVHFVGRSGNKVESPKRINIEIPNIEGVRFTVEESRFSGIYAPVKKWTARQTLGKQFRCLYEIAGRLECCFLNYIAKEKLPGVARYISRSMFDFLGVENFEDFSYSKWVQSAQDCH